VKTVSTREWDPHWNGSEEIHKDVSQLNGSYQRTPLGEGDIPYTQIFESMKKDHYSQYVTLEPEVDRKGVFRSVQRLQDALN